MGFPVSPQPSPGDTYSVDNRIWAYDGFGWRFLGASGSVNVTLTGNVNYTIGNTAPSSPSNGDKWFHINDAVEYTYIQDYDDTNHWIEIGMGCPSIGGETGINFPTTECVGDIYEYDSRIWIYKGYGWKIVCQNTGDSEFTFGLTAPNDPNPGHRWVDSATGLLYTFIDDEDPSGQTGQWVAFSNASEIIGPQGPTGPTGEPGPRGPTGYVNIAAGRGISFYEYGGASYFEFNYSNPGPTGLTFATITTASSSDKILLQRKPSDKMEFITVGNLLATALPSLPSDIPNTLSGYKFAFYDASGIAYSSSETNVKSQILGNNITSLNGCTGAVGITGTTGEIEVTKSCPNIIIGLPDNVTISGSLTVGGFYYGFIDGGTFE